MHRLRCACHRRHGAQGRQQRCRCHLQRAGVFRRRDAGPHRPGMEIILLLFAFEVLCGALQTLFSANSPLEGYSFIGWYGILDLVQQIGIYKELII